MSGGSDPGKRRPGQAGGARPSRADGLDMRASVEGPSTTTPHPTTSREQPGCDPTPTRSQPVRDAMPDPPDRSTPGRGRVRVLRPDYVALNPEHRAQAIRALTELILTWTDRTRPPVPADLDLDEAA